VKEFLVLAAAALVLSLPLFVHGPMLAAHDTKEHLGFGECFADQFWQGDLYPHWLLNLNHGLGSPSFFIYPPFPSLVYAFLLSVERVLHVNAFTLGEYLCLLTSGLSAFLWMTTIAGKRVSLVVAVIYMLLPYHLAVDFYRRDALSECWGLAWMPLVLFFTTQVVRKKRFAVVGLALSYALLIFSHFVSVLILSALPLLLVLVIAERGRKTKAVLTVIGGLVLGAIVSAAYLLPAFANAKYFPVAMLDIPINNGPNGDLLAFGWDLFTGRSGKNQYVQAESLAAVSTVAFIAFCGFMALKKGPRSRRGQTWLWLTVCPIPLFLMSGPSQWVWNTFPMLADAIQFPSRFSVVLCVAALPLAAFLLTDLAQRPARSKLGLLVIVSLFAASWFGAYVYAVKRLTRIPDDTVSKYSVHDGWYAAWTPRGTDLVSAIEASVGPRVRFLSGKGSAAVLLWKARHIEVQTDCDQCGPADELLIVSQFYYPKWQARLVPDGTSLPIEPVLPQGLIQVQVPPGHQQIRLEIPRGLDEQIGNWLSALGVLVCGALFVSGLVRGRAHSTS
jgi:hypothetical protein